MIEKETVKFDSANRSLGTIKSLDAFQRMNFLLRLGEETKKTAPCLSQFYIYNMLQVAEKTVNRISSGLKTRICKDCNRLIDFNEGTTKKRQGGLFVLVAACKFCGKKKKRIIGRTKNRRRKAVLPPKSPEKS
eukprot:TRINITY_DN5835_c0_g2_i1.p1 TRINITY_DN5835_c0_g2~~TRINITY_DN5835_c0_g2_i1.p1  ORF type:complete len:133 (-),score=17.09 TRINITY_DN5835_c0_g2_i1:10-408(-)